MADETATQTAPKESSATTPAPDAAATATASSDAAPAAAYQGQDAATATAPAPAATPAESQGVEVTSAQLPEADEQVVDNTPGQVDILLDATMPVSVGLGQVSMQVRQLLALGPGSVIKLDRQVGQPVDLYLRGIRFATGHLVVVGDNLGVRLKEILPAAMTQAAGG